ncbi:MAG TPA: aquaporin [Gemmatimonadales bacterium]|nr:aquaporin [Gemmatimonadales bacterium]
MMRPRIHLAEYGYEALGLGLFMISACSFGVLLFHPASPLVALIPRELPRRAIMGLAMGMTLVMNIYSPWGRRSGAHLNPAVTLTFLRLGKVKRFDAAWYIVAQFAGGLLGTAIAALLLRRWIADPAVNYVATVPGMSGLLPAFLAEVVISFLLMLVVLVSNTSRLARFTGFVAGSLVALYITIETPISGMSMNPARTTGSAAFAHVWTGSWIYFLAPLLGMLLAAEGYMRLRRVRRAACAKLYHDAGHCIFCEE